MLLIVANIVARQHRPSAKRVITHGQLWFGCCDQLWHFGAVGVIWAIFGYTKLATKPCYFANFAGLFIVLGLYMLDVIRWQLPHALRVKFQKISPNWEKSTLVALW